MPLQMMASMAIVMENGLYTYGRVVSFMDSALTQVQVFIALIVAAHAAVLAVRLCVSLYNA
ncbi:photosystem I reaction center subunit XII [cyanobiont of Ornithocercus magnificus]|nr:photosystem I reaction center subunit XII [cyanobiont of Ornithocercus magnificus]